MMMLGLPTFGHLLFVAALLFAVSPLRAVAEEEALPPVVPTIREVAPGIFEIGKVHLDKESLTVTFAGSVNMDKGLLEYLIVTPQGSTHESLLITDVQPNDLHFAMLLLGAKGSGLAAPAPGDAPPPQIDAKYLKTAPRLKGDSVSIQVRWKAGNEEKTAPVEDWLFNEQTKKPAERGSWIYNASMFGNGHFLAQIEGAVAALVTNPAALINNPRKGNDDDQIWAVNEKAVPAVNFPVQIIIHLLPPPPETPAASPAKP